MSENLTQLKTKIQISNQENSGIDQESISEINEICKKINTDKIKNVLINNPKMDIKNANIISKFFIHYTKIFIKNGYEIESINDSNLKNNLKMIVEPLQKEAIKKLRIEQILNEI